MKRPSLLLLSPIVIALAWLALAFAPSTADAADTFRFSGRGASAGFFSVDGDILTFVDVFAEDFIARFHDPPGGPPSTFTGSDVFLNIFQIDTQGTEDPADDTFSAIFGFAPLTPDQFQVDRFLTLATLVVDDVPALACDLIPPFFFECDPATITATEIDLNLTWAGFGNLSREGGNFHFRSPGFIINGHFRGTSRFAAVSGSVISEDGLTDFTGGATGFGSMFSVRSGVVTID